MKKELPFFKSVGFLYFFAVVTSLILSLGIGLRQAIINPDAVCYLTSAEAIGRIGIKGAMQICSQANWPFYPAIIYGVVQITHLSYPAAGYAVDAIFTALSVLFFLMIVKKLGATQRILWLAAGVILLSHEFNGVREYIIRDHGFWVCYLLSILLLLNFFTQPNWKSAIGWSASLLAATLFRIEGAIFLLVLPYLAWCSASFSWRERTKCFFMLNALLLGIVAIIGAWLVLHPQQTLNQLGRVPEILVQFKQGFMIVVDRYTSTKAALADHVLIHERSKNAGSIYFILMGAWYLFNLVVSLSVIYTALVIYAWLYRSTHWAQQAGWIIGGYILVNVMVTSGFLLENLFLSKRYLVALCLTLMLMVPFALNSLFENAKQSNQQRHKLTWWAVCLCIVFSAVGGIVDFGYSKAYVYDAGKWISANIPAKAKLYSNDSQMLYYAKIYGDDLFQQMKANGDEDVLTNGRWQQFDYLAFRISKHDLNKIQNLLHELVALEVAARFENKRGDLVMIYKVEHGKKKKGVNA